MHEASRLPHRIRVHVRVPDDHGCWEWIGRIDDDGYGRVWLRRHQLAHRVVWILLVGELADALPLDHTCCSPAICKGGPTCLHRRCVNPDHLLPSTIGDNVLRGNGITARNAAATQCLRGHPFTPENTYVRPDRPTRSCRKCQRIRERAYALRLRTGGSR